MLSCLTILNVDHFHRSEVSVVCIYKLNKTQIFFAAGNVRVDDVDNNIIVDAVQAEFRGAHSVIGKFCPNKNFCDV